MKGSTTKLLKKVNDICEEGTIWKVFFGLFAALLAADLLLPALTGEKAEAVVLHPGRCGHGQRLL